MEEPDQEPGPSPEPDHPVDPAGLALIRSPQLRDELRRYSWMPAAWQKQSAQSQADYDNWVSAGRTRGQATRRADKVARRCYTGRPWTGSRYRRGVDAVRDFFTAAPPLPRGADGIEPTIFYR